MKKIQLGGHRKFKHKENPIQGWALVDDKDYEWLNQWTWRMLPNGYVHREEMVSTKHKIFTMHRELMKHPKGMVVDHINGNRLDNRQVNLRICTHSQNLMNKKFKKGASGFRGVSRCGNRWRAYLMINYKQINLGLYPDKEKAYKAYCEGSKKYHKEFSRI